MNNYGLQDFFQLQPIPANYFTGHYDPFLVFLSYLVAVFASYIALDLTGRLRDRNNTETSRFLWLIGGSIAMGSGIWTMHFIGMLSFTIPGLVLKYELFWTILSLFVAIIASGFALYLLKRSIINVVHLVAGGFILGIAIASMHYTGMAAMLITLDIRYLPGLFLLSILIAIVASEAAIYSALKSNTIILRLRNRIKIISAVIMGIAITGMHYTAMAASVFTPLCAPASSSPYVLNTNILAVTIAAVTIIILSVAFFASSYKENINQQQFERARQLGMEEISASVLHSVGNVLNSLNIAVETISEKDLSSPIKELKKLSSFLGEQNQGSGSLSNQDQNAKLLVFLNKLIEYMERERTDVHKEVQGLTKNIQTIKSIISTQQKLSKKMGIEEVIAVDELIEEALLITGLNTKREIDIKKTYEKMNPIIADKVKLMQVFVNILRNAKDALMESSNKNKTLTIKTSLKNNTILIQISDNGMGISPSNINKIFHHGFTTKKEGHGFGLHASALAMNELGGEINVESEGLGKGASFFLKLPYRRSKLVSPV